MMRTSGLRGAAIAVLLLAPIAPANADISSGDLLSTDLFRWSNWRELLGNFDCTEELTFYLWNAPSPTPPVIIAPPPAIDPVVATPPVNSSAAAVDPADPADPANPHDPVHTVDPVDPHDPAPDVGVPSALTDPVDLAEALGDGDPRAASAVPEPSTWAMLLLGFVALGWAGFRRHGHLSDQDRRANSSKSSVQV